jgi:predicted transcriptional regulator YdeE
MEKTSIQEIPVVGITIRTSNETGKASIDIPNLWDKFFKENISGLIPDIVDSSIYCIYTDYEDDYTKPYTVLIGHKVSSLDSIPEGLTGKSISGGPYRVFTASGSLHDGIVFEEWTKIWNSGISRVYTTDFEVYGEKAQNPQNAEVDIFIAVK